MSALKQRTHYRCAVNCGNTLYTGDMTAHRPSDDRCRCGAVWVEADDPDVLWRVSWEMIGPFDDDWRPVHRETHDEQSARDQHATLTEWGRTGDEPIRNVKLERADAPAWQEVT